MCCTCTKHQLSFKFPAFGALLVAAVFGSTFFAGLVEFGTAQDHPAQVATSMNTADDLKLPDLPFSITSFGACQSDGYLYTFGGWREGAHKYFSGGQNGKLMRLKIGSKSKWETLCDSDGLQGLAMVAYKNRVYRIGGFEARNKKGDEQDLHSVDEFAVFDMDKKSWTQLAPMPVARSSFDAVVVDGTVFVMGGWTLAGDGNTTWCDTAISIDLKKDNPKWTEVKKPGVKRRAVSVGYQDGSIVMVGGMQDRGGPTTKVAIYDIEKDEWSEGPKIDGGGMEGFGSSCFNIGGRLVVSTHSGSIYRLSADMKKWETAGKLNEGRFFHRLLPIDGGRGVVISGSKKESGRSADVEVFSVNSESTEDNN